MGKRGSKEFVGGVRHGHSSSSPATASSAPPAPSSSAVSQDMTPSLNAVRFDLNAASRTATTLPVTSVVTLN